MMAEPKSAGGRWPPPNPFIVATSLQRFQLLWNAEHPRRLHPPARVGQGRDPSAQDTDTSHGNHPTLSRELISNCAVRRQLSTRSSGAYHTTSGSPLFLIFAPGNGVLACSAPLRQPDAQRPGCLFPCARHGPLIAFGPRRIKPCVLGFFADQFKPEQSQLLQKAYVGAFLLGHHIAGVLFRFLIVPWVRDRHG